jgi:DNA replicative helicase MCM subunit Mcm2 (Cdc46/Mcm family)
LFFSIVTIRILHYCQSTNDEDGNENDVVDNNEEDNVLADIISTKAHPYAKQARKMVRKLLFRLAPQSTSINNDGNDNANTDDEATFRSGFVYTMFVDFQHIQVCDTELAEAIESDYNRFEYFLRRGVYQFIVERYPEIRNHVSHKSSYQFFVAMHNLNTVLPLRSLKMGNLCRLTSVTGTITRTTEVRPELLVGAFRCMSCGLLASTVIQQYHLTRPALCRNPRCRSTSPSNFVLENQQCVFGDWQKLRVQENSDHIPPGCMPRTFDVMIRHEMVEHAKAGTFSRVRLSSILQSVINLHVRRLLL